jgi:hypothetical protein
MAAEVTYDGPALYEMLEEVQGYLAELRYIDSAMAYLESEDAGWLQEYGGGIITPGTEYVDVEFGKTFPFTKRYGFRSDWHDSLFGLWDDTRSERVNERLNELAGGATSWAETGVESVREGIKPYTWFSGGLYESDVLTPIETMHQSLEDEVSDDFGLLQHSLSDWKGDAADNFASNFYFPFEHTLRSQKQMLAALLGGLASAKAVAESTQHSIMTLVHCTKEALLQQLEIAHVTAKLERQQSQYNAMIIAVGATTVFAGILSGGSLWAVGFAAAAGGATIASTTIPTDAATEYVLQGSTAEELLNGLLDGISTVKTNDGQQHGTLLDEVNATLTRVGTLRGGPEGEDGRLIPIQPDIIDGVDGSTFYMP